MSSWRLKVVVAATSALASAVVFVHAQASRDPDWKALEDETMRHYQAVLRLDTRNPPGNEHVVVDYVKGVSRKRAFRSRSSHPTRTDRISWRASKATAGSGR